MLGSTLNPFATGIASGSAGIGLTAITNPRLFVILIVTIILA